MKIREFSYQVLLSVTLTDEKDGGCYLHGVTTSVSEVIGADGLIAEEMSGDKGVLLPHKIFTAAAWVFVSQVDCVLAFFFTWQFPEVKRFFIALNSKNII